MNSMEAVFALDLLFCLQLLLHQFSPPFFLHKFVSALLAKELGCCLFVLDTIISLQVTYAPISSGTCIWKKLGAPVTPAPLKHVISAWRGFGSAFNKSM